VKILAFIRQRSFARYVMFDLADAARRMGWSVKWVDLEGLASSHGGQSEREKQALIDGILYDIEVFDPDVVFSYGLEYLERVFESLLPHVRSRLSELIGRPGAYFVFDFGFPFDRPVDRVTSGYLEPLQSWNSLMFVWDDAALETVRRFGVTNAFRFPMAVNERMFYRTAEVPGAESIPVVFVGGPSVERIAHLEPLAEMGLHVFGYDPDGWRSSPALARCYREEVLERDRLRGIYNRAAIGINITRPHGPASLNMRVYESMACGSLIITDDRKQVQELFVAGEEIVTYSGVADLRMKVEYYLSHDAEREAIARRGMDAVRNRHTYLSRLNEAAPILRQFVIEHRAAMKLEAFAAADPGKALRFARYLDDESIVQFNVTNLRCSEADLRLRLGDPAAAAHFLDDALARNAQHLSARRQRNMLTRVTGTSAQAGNDTPEDSAGGGA
jgi:hypothetical protein